MFNKFRFRILAVSLNSLKVSFSDDEKIKMRLYLIEKYNHGNCFGMPGPKNPRTQRKISPKLFLKVKYLLPEKSDNECKKIIKIVSC